MVHARYIWRAAFALGLFMAVSFSNPDYHGFGFILSVETAEAKSYKSIAVPECEAEIPEGLFLPPYQPAFGYYEYARAADGSTITLIFYYDLRFSYFDKDWEELAPYMEAIKWEGGSPHLIGLSFVNEEGQFVLYADANNDTELPAVDRLTQIQERSPLVKRAPREMKKGEQGIGNRKSQ